MKGAWAVAPIVLGSIALLGTAALAQESVPLATIHVASMLPFGGADKAADVSLRGVDKPEREFYAFGADVTLSGVPYGRYMLRVKHSEHSVERLVTVNARESWVRVGIPILRVHDSDGPGGSAEARGKVAFRGAKPKDAWVRVEGLYFDTRVEQPIGPDGSFELRGLDIGTHVLQVIAGDALHTRTVEVGTRSASELRIVIGETTSKPSRVQ